MFSLPALLFRSLFAWQAAAVKDHDRFDSPLEQFVNVAENIFDVTVITCVIYTQIHLS